MPLMRGQSLHRAEILTRLGHLVARKAGVMFPLEAIEHANITHRQGQAGQGFRDAGRDQAPARRFSPR